MPLTLDRIDIAAADPDAAREFYCAAFTLDASSAPTLDLHGVGSLSFTGTGSPAATPPTGSVVISYLLEQPSQVSAVIDAAAAAGATVASPPKKGFFGGFAGTFASPDGTLWKIASPHKKDKGAASHPPRPTEIVVLLGVPDVGAEREFYVGQGMRPDNNYGSKFVDFTYAATSFKLGLIPAKGLAKDVGADAGPASNVVLLTDSVAEPFSDPAGIRWAPTS